MRSNGVPGFRFFLRIAAIIAVLFAILPGLALAQEDSQVTWETYDVTVEVREDGTLRVTESIVIEFNGIFRQGKRTIPMDRIESIDDVEVSVGTESGDLTQSRKIDQTVLLEHGEFNARNSFGEFIIDYGFERTMGDGSDNVRSVVISYTVHGAIRNYPDVDPPEQQVRWTAISSEVTETGPIESASATIIFPEPIDQAQLGIDPDATTVEPDRVVWESDGLDQGDSLRVAVAFPTVTDAVAPAWQANADTFEGRQEMLPGIHLLLGVIAFVVSVITILFMVVRGVRDPEVGLVADIIPQRPDDLPAPLVGTLVDESVDAKDVIAGLLDAERLGIISITEGEMEKGKQSYRLRLNSGIDTAPAWHKAMLEGLFSGGADIGEDVDLADRMKTMRQTAFTEIKSGYEEELYRRGFFAELPHTTRMRWIGWLFLIFAVFAAAVGVSWWWAQKFSGWAAVPLAIAGIGLIIGLSLSAKAAVKTTEGAVVAAKWKAFGRYVQQLRKGPEPQRFFEVLEQDLPWAVALGFDSSWSKLADRMPEPARSTRNRDSWGRSPVVIGGMGGNSGAESSSSGGDRMGSGGLQGASASTLAAIGGGSSGLFSMLNSASAGFTAGASSGSGGSGGSSGGSFSGSSSVGSSGGGGHSFS